MPRITPNDPSRITEHDFLVMDTKAFLDGHRSKPRMVAAFDNQAEAIAYIAGQAKPGQLWIIDILHPDGCGCNPLEPVRKGINN